MVLPEKRRILYRLGLAVAVVGAVVMASCEGKNTPTSPSLVGPVVGGNESGALDAKGGGSDKVTLCHREGNGGHHRIDVSTNAEAAHRAHGDAAPFEPVPGQDGMFFDEDCQVVPSCPGCPITTTVTPS